MRADNPLPQPAVLAQPAVLVEWTLFPSHISVASFVDGFLDLVVFARFRVYCTMMTGNLIALGVVLLARDALSAAFLVSVIFSYIVGYLCMLLIFARLPNEKHITYMLVLPAQLAGVAVLAFAYVDRKEQARFLVLPLVFSYGLLNSWALKWGFVPGMMTGNIQKLADALFKCTRAGTASFSARERGDLCILSLELACYFGGILVAAALLAVFSTTSSVPFIAIMPIIAAKLCLSRSICRDGVAPE